MAKRLDLEESLAAISKETANLQWKLHERMVDGTKTPIYEWMWGNDDFGVMVIDKDTVDSRFRRHDFFYGFFVFRGAIEVRQDPNPDSEWVRVGSGECYIGQPFSGCAIRLAAGEEDSVALAVLTKKEFFLSTVLSKIAADGRLVDFFLNPGKDERSSVSQHIMEFPDDSYRKLNELIAVEYANGGPDVQNILRGLMFTMVMMDAKYFKPIEDPRSDSSVTARITRYLEDNLAAADLRTLSRVFHYSPAYISRRYREVSGQSLSSTLLKLRMKRALVLMKKTGFTLEQIAPMVGYNDKGTFHRAFRRAFGTTPREYQKRSKRG